MIPRSRNHIALTEEQVESVRIDWGFLNGGETDPVPLDFTRARIHSSLTVFNEGDGKVYVGADVYPGTGSEPRSRMSMLACLAHEFSHAQRFRLGYRRGTDIPVLFIDEAETSLRAACNPGIGREDRIVLVQDARNRLLQWLDYVQSGGAA